MPHTVEPQCQPELGDQSPCWCPARTHCKTCKAALAAYEAVQDPALAAYKAAYKAATGPALAAHEAAVGSAWAAYKAVRNPARATYEAVQANHPNH